MKTLILSAVLAFLSFSTVAHAQTPTAAPAPRCMVDQFYGNFHMGTSAAGDTVAMIWCDDQLGLDWWAMAGNTSGTIAPACLLSAGPPSWSLAYLQAAWNSCAAVNLTPMNADHVAERDVLLKQWLPRLSVVGPSQNVYTQNADGTRGPQFVSGGFGMKIAAGLRCTGLRLKNAGDRFADVSGLLSTNGVLLPSGSFALCSITYPPAGGFTN